MLWIAIVTTNCDFITDWLVYCESVVVIVPVTSSWMISSVAMFVLVAVIAVINQNYCNRDDW